MKAIDLMHPLTDYLRPDASLKDAVALLKTCRVGEENICVRALPVLDEHKKFVGLLSMGDILKAIWPSYMSLMNLGDFTWDGMVEGLAKKSQDLPVKDLMTREVITVHEDAPLMECVDHMLKFGVKKLPVIDASGRVAGMLYERDLFFAIVGAMLNNTSLPGDKP
jgi:CBS domain-containing protein